jgi:hypothetical protein
MTTVYLTANKLISDLKSYFDEDKINNASFVALYFDKVYESKFGGNTNILKMCLISNKLEVLQQKYMPKFKFNLSE